MLKLSHKSPFKNASPVGQFLNQLWSSYLSEHSVMPFDIFESNKNIVTTDGVTGSQQTNTKTLSPFIDLWF